MCKFIEIVVKFQNCFLIQIYAYGVPGASCVAVLLSDSILRLFYSYLTFVLLVWFNFLDKKAVKELYERRR